MMWLFTGLYGRCLSMDRQTFCQSKNITAALKFCFKTCVAMKFVDDDDDDYVMQH